MRISALILLVVASFAVPSGHLCAQNFLGDYFKNVPRSYSPDDPWVMGKLLRTEVGHGGFYYNCDSEECKRQSPYVTWNRQSTECIPSHPIKRSIFHQFDELKQRIAWGSCGQSCPQKCNGGSGCNSGGRCVSGLQAIVPSRHLLKTRSRSSQRCSGGENCGCSGCLSKNVPSAQPGEVKESVSRGLLANLKILRGNEQQLQRVEKSTKLVKAQASQSVKSLVSINQQAQSASRDASRRVIERLLGQRNDATTRVANQLKQQATQKTPSSRNAKKSDDDFRMIR